MNPGQRIMLRRRSSRLLLELVPRFPLPEIANDEVRRIAQTFLAARVVRATSDTGFNVGDVVVPFRGIPWDRAGELKSANRSRLSLNQLALILDAQHRKSSQVQGTVRELALAA